MEWAKAEAFARQKAEVWNEAERRTRRSFDELLQAETESKLQPRKQSRFSVATELESDARRKAEESAHSSAEIAQQKKIENSQLEDQALEDLNYRREAEEQAKEESEFRRNVKESALIDESERKEAERTAREEAVSRRKAEEMAGRLLVLNQSPKDDKPSRETRQQPPGLGGLAFSSTDIEALD